MSTTRLIAVSIFIAGTSAAPAWSQTLNQQASDEQVVATSFDALSALVKPGDPLIVVTANGRRISGTLDALSVASLALRPRRRAETDVRRFSPVSAREVHVERRDSIWNGVAIGAATTFAPPFFGWGASGSGTPRSTVVAVLSGSAAVGAAAGLLIDRAWKDEVVVYRARPAATFDELQALVGPGDLLVVSRTDGTIVMGRAVRVSAASLELAGGSRAPVLSRVDIEAIDVERSDPWWPSAVAGAAVAAANAAGLSYSIRCSDLHTPCPNFRAPRQDLVLITALGAGIGGLIDWLRKDRATVFQSPAARRIHGARAEILLPRSGVAGHIVVRF